MFVLQRNEPLKNGHRALVASGAENSYTSSIEKADKFPSRCQAEAEACGNEMPVHIDYLF